MWLRLHSLFWTGVTILAFPAAAVAQKPEDQQPLNLPEDGSAQATDFNIWAMLFRTVVAMALTVGVIFLVYKFFKSMHSRPGLAGRGPALECMSRTVVDRDLTLYVLRNGEQVTLLARSSHEMKILRQISCQEAEEQGLTKSVEPASQNFKLNLKEAKQKLETLSRQRFGTRSKTGAENGEPSEETSVVEEQPQSVEELLRASEDDPMEEYFELSEELGDGQAEDSLSEAGGDEQGPQPEGPVVSVPAEDAEDAAEVDADDSQPQERAPSPEKKPAHRRATSSRRKTAQESA